MDDPRILTLLEEIRDLLQQQGDEYRALAARSNELSEEAVARQAAMVSYYKKVVLVALMVLGSLLPLVFVFYLTR